jgi:hypothetical protein
MPAQVVVILAHGLWVHGVVMAPLRHRIARCGYRVVSYSYPSVRLTLIDNAGRLAHLCRSLGGLIVLRALE